MEIYLVTNTFNGKRYVGKTSKTAEERWKTHNYNLKRGSCVQKAIIKYGRDAFTVETIGRFDDEETPEQRRTAIHIRTQDQNS